ncbi:4a-hydroxytetrahydrobiopterin dehydratase [Hydrogenivirga caldilitoris]|uniref:Putative pterin-4-alpha-carbinolamine dehydratase n=1 Tax=Hydrogenivirga caldilitoris TaxID=246264 RepID=A0A497XQD7_9AQUI|nr:4a-hydroxytetrahydrobiopterin dehydratase [Hydrogenivirga caldilitoris]RLJ71185.1 4a-hydroxytetrahydrobiopterin dehydratase [Hydrogenivirga caldilitoris]
MERLSPEDIEGRLKELEDWSLEGNYITKVYETKNWKTTIFVVNAIAALAEAHWHHPDLEVGFKRVKVKLTTHEAGGITERDFKLAEDIDRIVKEIMRH